MYLMNSASTVRLCIPVCVRAAPDLPRAVDGAAAVADVIELRFDCLEEAQLDSLLVEQGRHLGELISRCQRPLIFTFRPAEQGGRRALSFAERGHFWRSLSYWFEGRRCVPAFADLELDYDHWLGWKIEEVSARGSTVICSHHDFVGMPADLEKIYEQMTGTGAKILKIAAQADDVTDCIPIFRLLERARREGREMIAVAMGEAGLMTRILAPSRGSFLTYGALDDEQRTAPGQLGARELRDLYRVHSINRQTQVTGLVGSPIAHSVSPHMHNAALAARGANAVYIPFEVRDIKEFVRRLVHPRTREFEWDLRGLSVTAPHKRAVIEHLDWIEPKAREIGAVNTIAVEEDALYGYNTDAEAAVTPLTEVIELRDARVAVIGAGGAARAALWSLRARGARPTIFARQPERARQLAAAFDAQTAMLADAHFDNFDVVINTTPLGTRGQFEHQTPAIAAQLRGARVVSDFVYNPPVTRFMREARDAGCRTIGGLPMLVAQAAAQFKLWTGEDAPLEVMRRAAERALK